MAHFISLDQPHIITHKESVCTSRASISKNNWWTKCEQTRAVYCNNHTEFPWSW